MNNSNKPKLISIEFLNYTDSNIAEIQADPNTNIFWGIFIVLFISKMLHRTGAEFK